MIEQMLTQTQIQTRFDITGCGSQVLAYLHRPNGCPARQPWNQCPRNG